MAAVRQPKLASISALERTKRRNLRKTDRRGQSTANFNFAWVTPTHPRRLKHLRAKQARQTAKPLETAAPRSPFPAAQNQPQMSLSNLAATGRTMNDQESTPMAAKNFAALFNQSRRAVLKSLG